MNEYRLVSGKDAALRADNTSWGSLTWCASKAISETGHLTVGRVVIKRGCCNPRHRHPDCVEVLHLLTGELEHSVGEKIVGLKASDTLVVDANVVHNARSVGAVDAEMIVVYDTGQRTVIGE